MQQKQNIARKTCNITTTKTAAAVGKSHRNIPKSNCSMEVYCEEKYHFFLFLIGKRSPKTYTVLLLEQHALKKSREVLHLASLWGKLYMADTLFEKFMRPAKVCGLFSLVCAFQVLIG